MMETELNQKITKLFPVFELILPKKVLCELINATPDEMDSFHFSFGLFIRNNLLISGSSLYDAFINAGINHKDDMSLMIIKLFYKHLITTRR